MNSLPLLKISDSRTAMELPNSFMPMDNEALVEALFNHVMDIDDEESLEKEWVRSSKPYPICLSLRKIQQSLRVDNKMDRDCFNMAVRKLAYDEVPTSNVILKHYLDLQFCIISDIYRHPKWRKPFDMQALANSVDRWPGIDYDLSFSKMILMPFAILGHYILFVLDMAKSTISILDSYPVSYKYSHIPDKAYDEKISKLSSNLNLALRVVIPEFDSDIASWKRILPAGVPTIPNCSLTGLFVFNFMRAWNGETLEPPTYTDGDALRKQFMVHLLKYNGNEAEDNMPEVVREYLRRIKN